MFGTQRDFENRIAEYRSNSVGIKHLHRLSPPLFGPIETATESTH